MNGAFYYATASCPEMQINSIAQDLCANILIYIIKWVQTHKNIVLKNIKTHQWQKNHGPDTQDSQRIVFRPVKIIDHRF